MSASLNVSNLNKLIMRLENIQPVQFDMRHVCGTACCITGWSGVFFGKSVGSFINMHDEDGGNNYRDLIMPDYENDGWRDHPERYPLSRAIATLKRLRDRFLATGEVVVDWGAEPGSEPAQPWTAPQAIEIREPLLPETLTRLLGAKVEA